MINASPVVKVLGLVLAISPHVSCPMLYASDHTRKSGGIDGERFDGGEGGGGLKGVFDFYHTAQ